MLDGEGRLRVGVVGHDASVNALGRAVVMADLLGGWCDVHIAAFGRRIWAPLVGDTRIELIDPPRTNLGLPAAARRLARAVRSDDLLVAIKPRALSYGLSSVVRRGRPLILDIDDLENRFVRRRMSLIRQIATPDHEPVTRLLERWHTRATTVTVASEALRLRYGGTWIPHIRDRRDYMQHAAHGRDAVRRQHSLEGHFVVGFVGTPRRHKGLDIAASAVSGLPSDSVLLVVGGIDDASYQAEIAELAGSTVRFVPAIPMDRVAAYLGACDVVIVPQTTSPEASFQSPARLLDAMAAGAAIIASDIGDAHRVLGEAGILVPPGSVGALREALLSMRDPEVRQKFGGAAGDRHRAVFELPEWAPVLRKLITDISGSRSEQEA